MVLNQRQVFIVVSDWEPYLGSHILWVFCGWLSLVSLCLWLWAWELGCFRYVFVLIRVYRVLLNMNRNLHAAFWSDSPSHLENRYNEGRPNHRIRMTRMNNTHLSQRFVLSRGFCFYGSNSIRNSVLLCVFLGLCIILQHCSGEILPVFGTQPSCNHGWVTMRTMTQDTHCVMCQTVCLLLQIKLWLRSMFN